MAEEYERVERMIGVAVDFSTCGNKALKWTVDNLVRKGDHLILIVVLPEGDYEQGEMQLWETTGSPLIPEIEFSDPIIMKKYGVYPDAKTLNIARVAVVQNGAVVLMKIYWGDAREKICEAVNNIPLSSLVVGSKGLGSIKRAFLGNVTNYLVSNATCPVTVVKE